MKEAGIKTLAVLMVAMITLTSLAVSFGLIALVVGWIWIGVQSVWQIIL